MTDQTKVAEALRKAADFLEANPDKRTTGFFARDEYGVICHPRSPKACSWCALGRFMVEMDGDLFKTEQENPQGSLLFAPLREVMDDSTSDEIWLHNDDRFEAERTPEVTAKMRKIADELEAQAAA